MILGNRKTFSRSQRLIMPGFNDPWCDLVHLGESGPGRFSALRNF